VLKQHGPGVRAKKTEVLAPPGSPFHPRSSATCCRQECNCRTAIAFSCPQWTPAPAGGAAGATWRLRRLDLSGSLCVGVYMRPVSTRCARTISQVYLNGEKVDPEDRAICVDHADWCVSCPQLPLPFPSLSSLPFLLPQLTKCTSKFLIASSVTRDSCLLTGAIVAPAFDFETT
jgi:hypothetical protein